MPTNEGVIAVSPKSLVRRRLHVDPLDNLGQLLTNALENAKRPPRRAWIYVSGEDIVVEDEGEGLSVEQLKTAGESVHYGTGTISRFGEGIPLVANTLKEGLRIKSVCGGIYERFKLYPRSDGMHWELEETRKADDPPGTRVHMINMAPDTHLYDLSDYVRKFRGFGLVSGDDEVYFGLRGKESCRLIDPPELPPEHRDATDPGEDIRGWLWDDWPSLVDIYYMGQYVAEWKSPNYRICGIVEYTGVLDEKELTDDKRLIRNTKSFRRIDAYLKKKAKSFVPVKVVTSKLNVMGTQILREVLKALNMIQRDESRSSSHNGDGSGGRKAGSGGGRSGGGGSSGPRQSIMASLGGEYPTYAIVDQSIVFNNTSATCEAVKSSSGPVQRSVLQTLCSVSASVFAWQKDSTDWESVNDVILQAEITALNLES